MDLKHAYARTPADVWKNGVDGITSPAPAAVGAFKADQVAAAYAQVKQVITAARLDPAVLDRHDTKGFLALFAKDAQDYVSRPGHQSGRRRAAPVSQSRRRASPQQLPACSTGPAPLARWRRAPARSHGG